MPYLPAHHKMNILRTHSAYMGECFETLEEAQEYVKEEELDRFYPDLKIYELVEVKGAVKEQRPFGFRQDAEVKPSVSEEGGKREISCTVLTTQMTWQPRPRIPASAGDFPRYY